MKLTLAEPKFIKDSIGIIADIVAEARFKITPDAMELIAMDPANVAMIIFKLLSSTFVEYDVKEESIISINLNDLKQVLRRAKTNDVVTLGLEENKLKILFKSNTTRTFFLPLINLEEKEQKMPNLSFSATVTTKSDILNEAIEDVDIVAESVNFSAEEKTMLISAAGDLSRAVVEIKADKDTKIVAKEQVKSKYSIEYLKKMIQGSKLSDSVVINFSKDYPLKLSYNILNKLQMEFILAPRVDND